MLIAGHNVLASVGRTLSNMICLVEINTGKGLGSVASRWVGGVGGEHGGWIWCVGWGQVVVGVG